MITTEIISRTLEVYQVKAVEAKIAQLNRRAARLGLPEITYTKSAPQTKIVMNAETGEKRAFTFWYIDVTGPVLKIDGWVLCGALDHREGLVKAAPEMEVPREYWKADPHCDHCNVNRQRLDTYVIRNAETGQHMQVGRNCLGLYLGIDPTLAASMADYVVDVAEFWADDELMGSPSGGQTAWHIEYFLGWVSAFVRRNGWTSRGQASEGWGISATVDQVMHILCGKDEKEKEKLAPDASDFDTGQRVIDWVRSLDQDAQTNEYMFNLCQICDNEYVTPRSAGLISSAHVAYMRHLESEAKAARTADSQYFGKVGERLKGLELTVVSIRTWENNFGVTFFYSFDCGGNVVIWKASKDQGLTEGQTVTLDGSVKDHSEYKGTRQTVLTRCKVK